MASQLMEDGSFLFRPRNRSSVPTLCFRRTSYLEHTGVTCKRHIPAPSLLAGGPMCPGPSPAREPPC
ncbi:hypothetical protein EYF80_046675 [Liparis tanakae]|uniref:Uncharacterized protein n=1 Tax=Liparis tanakae TaxID=230148 RepID=A0A4Z2FQS2_9TELE|nr:hypothetical protein EYF80_046675 [Liparis tanakae]